MKKITTCLLAVLFICIAADAQIQTGENVAITNTDAGKVRGYIHNSIYTYKGIPYATAKRFEAPQKPKPWTGVRSSMSYGPVAPLETPTTSVQDESEFAFHHDWGYTNEDCMRVNVWTPGINDGKKRPVMFWIHGGGYSAGSSQELPSYDGENLSKTGDVVVVSINHRLNILGFLDMSAYGEKYKHSANVSIIDIKAALEWVKANIANFGGDPNNVTIFGQSGGGAKVNTLMAMPSAKGLFQKAINESGSFRTTMLDKATTQALTAEVLKALNLQPSQADSLQTIPFAQLSDAGRKALKVIADQMKAQGKTIPGFGLSWGPSVDGEDLPYQLFSKEAFELSKDVPLLIGTVKNEFMPSLFSGMSNATQDQVMAYIKKQRGDKADAYIAAVKKAYPDDTKPTDLMDVDAMFRPGAVSQANEKSALNAAPVYMYLFTWQSPVMDGKYKAVHCMELAFVFNNIARCEEMTGGNKDAYALAEKVSKAWINFARSGNPNHKGLPNWPAYNTTNTATMHFDNTCVVKPQMDKELFDLVSAQ
ncbi:carboxylesterase/lipase family protein [Panacibacter ginsenosidivorans]|uniref:Carboxylic ester hydrolase n=1 Tax=Panacibacter ginsenosidivorans TaxID=1813871 RepID=A0A5B8V6J4_9BACT|nr:carboxylesterase family protein [Panacibacter ginsenosidivorans]QEC66735.1 carboxylesterase/lipase family protein [Panacibacter ginsenosidivorans]